MEQTDETIPAMKTNVGMTSATSGGRVQETVCLSSRWYIQPGKEEAAWTALSELARAVEAEEPDALTYVILSPRPDHADMQSLPPVAPLAVTFFEMYRDPKAFQAHVNGPTFTQFLQQHGDLFLCSGSKPFWQVAFFHHQAGFIRPGAIRSPASEGEECRHPGVMVELIARDQERLKAFYCEAFCWHYQVGSEGFAYVHFPVRSQPLLAGIGQMQDGVPGFAPGHNFYLLVDDLEATVAAAVAAGGDHFVDPVAVDGYHFAMVKDPEGNPIGLIAPFDATA